MVIIGSNIRAIEFARNMEARPELGYRLLGFADEEWAGTETARKHGYSVLSDLDALPQYLRQNIVDEIVIALPMRSLYKHACRIAGSCEQQGIIVRVIPDLFNLRLAHVRTDGLDGAPITHSIVRNDTWGTIAKRVLDVTLSALAIMFLSPLLLLVALLIKLTSPGPVFFVQKRVGLNKRIFNIYKFRTMVVDAERKLQQVEHLNEVAGPVFKIKKDPRITPLGSFLRKTSIDELPQLFNVLHGDMSLVGPRPLQLRDYELFNKDCEDWQRCRFSVRPGITCLWQVNGRSSIPFEKWMELDLLYVHKWSLWLDLQILARTIPAVLRGLGAA
jgi:exopolysaccharide biosynthesis polyprenyl glycosylphosphotransferase